MKRTFIAFKVPLPTEFEAFYHELQEYFLDQPMKWVPLENMHITLNFLGTTSREAEKDVVHLLDEIVPQFSAFKLKLKGLGAFPSQQKPKVMWFGLLIDQWLFLLQESLHVNLLKLGFELDTRPFNPHLTIGRVKGTLSKSFPAKQKEGKKLNSNEIQVNEIIYFESILKGKSPVYRPIQKFQLAQQ